MPHEPEPGCIEQRVKVVASLRNHPRSRRIFSRSRFSFCGEPRKGGKVAMQLGA
jgi:hypothetical protein